MTELHVRRVVLPADAERDLRSIDGAIAIGRALGAEVEALFVEDADLFAWAGHPLSRRIDRHGGRPLSMGDLEVEWRALRTTIERALAREAQRRDTVLRFGAVRARPQDVLRVRVSEGDLVLAPTGRLDVSRVQVIVDRSSSAQRALEAAIRIAGAHGELDAWLADRDLVAGVELTLRGRVARSSVRLGSPREGLVLVPAEHPLADLALRRTRLPHAAAVVG